MKRWSVERARKWAKERPFLFGANFTPSTAINQLEMWQAETFDASTIESELVLANSIGMNIMRVYLHDLLWEQDKEGFVERIEEYLAIADACSIGTMFVIFDDCWNGDFSLGKQPDPVPYTHNSGWVQSPGHPVVEDPAQWPRLERYVKGLLGHFKDDPRVLMWDLYNEPGNGRIGDATEKKARSGRSDPLVKAVFEWARSVDGLSQPLTVGLWNIQESLNKIVLEESDIVSFHAYMKPNELNARIEKCAAAGRPMICSEWLARAYGSTFQDCLPVMKEKCIGAINWGLVDGKTQTKYPWGWKKEKGEPPVWHHDIFNTDGSLFYPEEEDVIRKVLG